MSVNQHEVKALREQRSKAHAAAIALMQANPNLTGEQRQQFDRAMKEVDELGMRIKAVETGASAYETGAYSPWTNPVEVRKALAFGKFLRGREIDQAERRDLTEGSVIGQIGTFTGLGYFVPAGFKYDIVQSMKYFAPLLNDEVFTIVETGTGNPLPYPTSDDTSNSAAIVSEGGTINEQDVTAGHVIFGAYKLSSGLIKASIELIQDSAFNLESWLAKRFGERYGRGAEGYLTNGTGSGQPLGLLSAIIATGASPVIANGSSESTGGSQTGANSIGYTDLVRLEHSVDPSYRRNGKYMFHDTTLSSLKQILDKYGRPLWVPGMKDDAPDTIMGYPYVINQSIPTISAAANSVVFGDMSQFVVRKVSDMTVQRLNELYATTGQVGFVSAMRFDAKLVETSGRALNCIQQHS